MIKDYCAGRIWSSRGPKG